MYTDVHSHIIWGVDDGAETREETFQMLREAAGDGIGRIVCTPHVTPGVYPFPEAVFDEHFREAEAYIRGEGLPLKLYRGAELLWTDNLPRLLRERKVPTLAGTDYALIEFSPADTAEQIFSALQKTAGAGFVPVIAHLERYRAIRNAEQVIEIKRKFRAMVQINARSLTGKQPLLRRKFFDSLFRDGLADLVATDTHMMPGRGTCMTAGMEALRLKYGDETAGRIREAPAMILKERGN